MTPTTAAAWPGACDCHMHVFEDSYPLAATATFKPPHAPAAHYQAVQQLLGLQRVVVVQPTGYAYDNRCTLDAMTQLGEGARGVAVIARDIAQAELESLHTAGMRGVRFMMLPGGVLGWDALAPTAARIAPLGWNINLQLDGRTLPQHEAALMALPCQLVIDHIGKFLEGPVTPADPAFMSLRRLLDTGRCWVKISGPYESSRTGPPGYEDVAVLARALITHYPERCLWASNWPHPNIKPGPSNTDLLRWFLDLTGSDAVAQKILVRNPAEVYGYQTLSLRA
ncbi:MAG: amidohydrolase family protein [Burkholderiaceae bacterium]|nr:amidohydrolase family protein [Burkholderiaceae bacterium]